MGGGTSEEDSDLGLEQPSSDMTVWPVVGEGWAEWGGVAVGRQVLHHGAGSAWRWGPLEGHRGGQPSQRQLLLCAQAGPILHRKAEK